MQPEDRGRLLYVLADGKLREQVEEGTDGAKLRVVKDDDGVEKSRKWELTYPGITGFITGVTTYDGDYGTNINILIKDANDKEFKLSLSAKSKYGEDFLHKLPNVDFTKEISIKPYNFEDDKRKITGVTLTQDNEKITNAFNWKNEAGEWESTEGYPQVDEKKKPKNSDQWMVFFTQRREWVIDNLISRGMLTEGAAAKADADF
jgi:hypothetical protein